MFRKFVKPVGGLMLGWSMLAAEDASAQSAVTLMPPVAATSAAAGGNGSHAASPNATSGYVEPGAASHVFANSPSDCAPGLWFNIDYVLMWMKAAPAPGPLATTGSFLDPLPGALGQPNTRVVFGNSEISNNAFSGMRVGAGTWIDEARTIGYEASGFTLEHRRNFQAINSNNNGVPFLARPFFDVQLNQEDALPVSIPGFQAGGLTASSSTRFTGWDFNVACNGTDTGDFRADALVGVRCLYLMESLTVGESIVALADQGTDESSLRQGERLSRADRFGTTNNFYGGQVGGRMTWISDRFVTTATVKLGIGVTDQIADLQGLASTRTAGAGIPAGFLVNAGNDGKYFQSQFAAIPELNLNVGYRIRQNVLLRVGYSVLYWSDVVRPGDTVTRAVNPGLVPTLQSFGTGPANQPRAQIDTTDFWLQGVNVGFEFRF